MSYLQETVRLSSKRRGCHLVTDELLQQATHIKDIKVGIAHFFIQHTSASLTLNENWDSDVRYDMEGILNRLVPTSSEYLHSCEGPDDMPAHGKASIFGASVSVPISNGALMLGTWQGIWMCEHRDRGSSRSVVVTVHGSTQ